MKCHYCCENKKRKIHHPDQILCQNDIKVGMRIKKMSSTSSREETFTVLSLPYLYGGTCDVLKGVYKIDVKEIGRRQDYEFVGDLGIEPHSNGEYNTSNYTILLKDDDKHECCHSTCCHCHCH